jgi:two-component system response regulator AtoC
MAPHPQRIISESPSMKKILADIPNIALSHANIFITGETGTGKEVIAQAIHSHSARSQCPFIKVNCAAVPDTLIESEFFGHEKGSFTGANAQHRGRFELADSGTLLLDEVTEIPLLLQAKLLRVVQEQEVERIGGTSPIKIDVRLISTSNHGISSAINQKLLREDLYYRLNVIPIHLLPLRDRVEDILPLTDYYLEKMCHQNGRPLKTLTADARQKLLDYQWPGNVRELANVLERAIIMSPSTTITPDLLLIDQHSLKPSLPIGLSLEQLEQQFILQTFEACQGNRKKTATQLGISLRTLATKLKNYALGFK